MEIFISYAFNLLYSSMKAHCKLGIRSPILKIKLIMQAKIIIKTVTDPELYLVIYLITT